MNPAGRSRIPLVIALLTGTGAILTSFLSFQLLMADAPFLLRQLLLPDPIGWAFSPRPNPLMLAAAATAAIVLIGLTWLFARLVVRSALPGRGAAVFFGIWGAMIIAAWAAGILRAPLHLAALRIPAEQMESLLPQLVQFSTSGAYWALTWGWIAALVAALLHRTRRGAVPSSPFAPPSAPAPQGGHPQVHAEVAPPPPLYPPAP